MMIEFMKSIHINRKLEPGDRKSSHPTCLVGNFIIYKFKVNSDTFLLYLF